MIGRVHKIAANDYEVHTAEGLFHCRFTGKLKRVHQGALKLAAVGDEVELVPGQERQGTIVKVMTRRSKLSRHDVMRPSKEQVIVANVDVLIIVQAACDPDFNDLVADKCTVMASANALPCVLVVNKSDLGRPDLAAYEQAGFRCLRTSTTTGEGLEGLAALLGGKTSVFMGPSGVGKSSLINALRPDLGLKVGEVSRTGEGRHTTTWVDLIPVAGGLVADTPGLEFFTFWGVTPENLKDHFLDLADLAEGCRFRNCSHTAEATCVVRGRAAPSRYRNYLAVRESLLSRRPAF